MALLGANTAESLLNTGYFYNGKLFGLQAGEHRLIRFQAKSNIVVAGNKIAFDEFRGKTYKGGLKDLKNKPRYIEQNIICTNSVFNNCTINFVVKKNHLMY